jgi:hypothetical protein
MLCLIIQCIGRPARVSLPQMGDRPRKHRQWPLSPWQACIRESWTADRVSSGPLLATAATLFVCAVGPGGSPFGPHGRGVRLRPSTCSSEQDVQTDLTSRPAHGQVSDFVQVLCVSAEPPRDRLSRSVGSRGANRGLRARLACLGWPPDHRPPLSSACERAVRGELVKPFAGCYGANTEPSCYIADAGGFLLPHEGEQLIGPRVARATRVRGRLLSSPCATSSTSLRRSTRRTINRTGCRWLASCCKHLERLLDPLTAPLQLI